MALTTANDFLNHLDAGLDLAGREEDGELLWWGDQNKWARYEYLHDKSFEEGDRDGRFDFGD